MASPSIESYYLRSVILRSAFQAKEIFDNHSLFSIEELFNYSVTSRNGEVKCCSIDRVAILLRNKCNNFPCALT